MQAEVRDPGKFEVLVVEDERECLEEYLELLRGLGYACLSASDGSEALKALAANPRIGVVLTDVSMPKMDGIALLGELQARFTPFRPLVAVVITGHADLDTAVEVVRSDAIDFLCKPVFFDKFAATMRRAAARWSFLDGQFRLFSLLEIGAIEVPDRNAAKNPRNSQNANPSRDCLKAFLRSVIKARAWRHDFIDIKDFADPAWDIMLDLTSAALDGRSVPVLSATAAANVPVTTALRYVNKLVEAGIVKRWEDPSDKRRSLLAIEDHALEGMLKYLTKAWSNMASDSFHVKNRTQ